MFSGYDIHQAYARAFRHTRSWHRLSERARYAYRAMAREINADLVELVGGAENVVTRGSAQCFLCGGQIKAQDYSGHQCQLRQRGPVHASQ